MKKELSLVWLDHITQGEDAVWNDFIESVEYDSEGEYIVVNLGSTIQIYKIS